MVDSVLFGSIVTSHIRQAELAQLIFRQNLDLFLDSLQIDDPITSVPLTLNS